MNSPSAFVASTLEVATTVIGTATTTATTTDSPTSGGIERAFPTALTTQLPSLWPYTRYGVGRRRSTATWALMSVSTGADGLAEEETVGLVKAVVSWFPRPVFEARSEATSGVGDVKRRAVEREEGDADGRVDTRALGELWDQIQALRRSWEKA
jgi:hypothetical protein